jgi:hypothetical protein
MTLEIVGSGVTVEIDGKRVAVTHHALARGGLVVCSRSTCHNDLAGITRGELVIDPAMRPDGDVIRWKRPPRRGQRFKDDGWLNRSRPMGPGEYRMPVGGWHLHAEDLPIVIECPRQRSGCRMLNIVDAALVVPKAPH